MFFILGDMFYKSVYFFLGIGSVTEAHGSIYSGNPLIMHCFNFILTQVSGIQSVSFI